MKDHVNSKIIYAVILNYNHLSDLIETVESFLNQDHPNLKIIVSDNNSTDGSQDHIRSKYPSVHLIENKTNLGWSGGNNVGIDYAIQQNADYIILSNNDIYFSDKTIISQLVSDLSANERFGIVGPSEYNYYKRTECINMGWILYPKSKHYFNLRRKEWDTPPGNGYNLVDNVSGSFMMIKTSLLKEIGKIDDNFFLYGEDADLSLRAWKMNYASIINKNIKVYHKISATSGKNSPLKIYYTTRNLIYLIRKHKDIQESHLYFCFKYYFDFTKLFLKISCFKEYSTNRAKIIKAYLQGAYHGAVLKKMGRYY